MIDFAVKVLSAYLPHRRQQRRKCRKLSLSHFRPLAAIVGCDRSIRGERQGELTRRRALSPGLRGL